MYRKRNDFFLWNGVVAASTPWIAGSDTLQGEPAALERAVLANGLDAIVGTGGRIAARAPDKRRKGHLVEPDKPYHDCAKALTEEFIQFPHSFQLPMSS